MSTSELMAWFFLGFGISLIVGALLFAAINVFWRVWCKLSERFGL